MVKRIYWQENLWKGGQNMQENEKSNVDLDDLIFDEDDGGPSER